jgi:hypothetical protein
LNAAIRKITVDASGSSNPVAVGNQAGLVAVVSPAMPGLPVTFELQDGNGGNWVYNAATNDAGEARASTGLLPVSVYKITVTAGTGCTNTVAYLPVYDPSGGFVTGGGWIQSPIVPNLPYMQQTGKANFGFVAKYRKGSAAVDGNTEFQFKAGNLSFKSTSHEAASLVIAGARAIYKGEGTINNAGSYQFMISAIDGQVSGGGGADLFRIKIWEKSTGTVVYDNQAGSDDNAQPATALGGGSIVIHQPSGGIKPKVSETITVAGSPISITLFPNPVSQVLQVRWLNASAGQTILQVTDAQGRVVLSRSAMRGKGWQTESVMVGHLPGGFYQLTLRQPHTAATAPFIKNNQ